MTKDKDQSSELGNLTAVPAESNILNPARIYEVSRETRCLDPTELAMLEQSFRSWAEDPVRADLRRPENVLC